MKFIEPHKFYRAVVLPAYPGGEPYMTHALVANPDHVVGRARQVESITAISPEFDSTEAAEQWAEFLAYLAREKKAILVENSDRHSIWVSLVLGVISHHIADRPCLIRNVVSFTMGFIVALVIFSIFQGEY